MKSSCGSRRPPRSSGAPDDADAHAPERYPADLPDDALVFLLPSRYCQSDQVGTFAFQQFGAVPPGWSRVHAISQWVHDHVSFDYGAASPPTTAVDVLDDGHGVCRDFAHLAIALCRALNIPARYVFGYLPDIDVPDPGVPMDFCAWMEVYLGDRWYTFDPAQPPAAHRTHGDRPWPRRRRRGDGHDLRRGGAQDDDCHRRADLRSPPVVTTESLGNVSVCSPGSVRHVNRVVESISPARLGTSFRWLLASSWVSNIGDGIALAAGPLLVASQTHDPLLVALAVLLQRLPWLLFGLYAGVVRRSPRPTAHRRRRRRLRMRASWWSCR